MLLFCVLSFICALWSPAGKGLTSWLSFVVSNCEFVTFPLVSRVRCGTLYRFLIFASLLTLFTEFCNCAKKIVILIRIGHTCVALKHKKTDLSLETSSEINYEYIKGALSWYGKLTWESAHAWKWIILRLLIVWGMTFIFMVHLSFYAIPLLIYDVMYDITTIP